MPKIEKVSATRNRRLISFVIFLALFAAAIVGFRGMGKWLVREDPLVHADALVVLSGGMPYRAEAAAHYFESGYASEVWVTRPESPSDQLNELGIHYVGDDDYSRQILIHFHVPETNIRVLPNTIIDTEEEVEEITQELRRTGKS